jgi:hypothetical protein
LQSEVIIDDADGCGVDDADASEGIVSRHCQWQLMSAKERDGFENGLRRAASALLTEFFLIFRVDAFN